MSRAATSQSTGIPARRGRRQSQSRGRSTDLELVILVRAYLKQVVAVQHELLRRLLDEDYEIPLNLAAAFEDAANRLLDASELISARHLEKQPQAD